MPIVWFIIIVLIVLKFGKATTQMMEKQGGNIPPVPKEVRAEPSDPDGEDTEQWRAAKEQQDDAEQLHAIHMDSCESKLESLRILHEAGILDNEEYAVRVARTKARHEQGIGGL